MRLNEQGKVQITCIIRYFLYERGKIRMYICICINKELRKDAWEMRSDDQDYWMDVGTQCTLCFLMPVVDTTTLFFPSQ